MAAGPSTQITDVVVPDVFMDYVQQRTEEKSNLVKSGVLASSEMLTSKLADGGKTFEMPSWKPLDNDADNVGTDDVADRVAATSAGAWGSLDNDSVPRKIETSQETAVRLSRNQSWGASDLSEMLAGSDPMDAIGGELAEYWERRLQAAFVATIQGISKDNGGNDSGDFSHDVVGSGFVAGTTNFTSAAYLRAKLTMGDSMDGLSTIMVHSVVYTQMAENNLIDFIPDARGETQFPTFMGMNVVMDDGMPSGTGVVRKDGSVGAAGMYETWLFGPGAVLLGSGNAPVPMEIERLPAAGNGQGMEVLHTRRVWSIHPKGLAYSGTAPDGGPSNAGTSNNLNHAASWNRVYDERKMIKFARLITREHA